MPLHDDDYPGDPEALVHLGDERPGLLFVQVPEGKSVKNRVHIDLQPELPRDEEVARLLALGATQVDDQRRPDGSAGSCWPTPRATSSASSAAPPSAGVDAGRQHGACRRAAGRRRGGAVGDGRDGADVRATRRDAAWRWPRCDWASRPWRWSPSWPPHRGLRPIRAALGTGHRGATVVAAAGVTAFQVLFFLAVRRSGVALGTVVTIGSAPIVTGLLAWATTRQRPAAAWAVATGLAIAGVALLLLPTGESAGMDALGLALAVGAGSGYAVYTVATRRVLDAGVAPLPAAAAAFAVAALLASPLLVVNDLSWATTTRGLAVVLWLGLAATALAYGLFATGLRTVPPATATTLGLVEPLVATLLGVVLLGERPGPPAIVGAVLLLAGLALTARATTR